MEKETVCERYVGEACIDGSCPIANREILEKHGIDTPKDCNDCWHYKGCDDCALFATKDCVSKRKGDEPMSHKLKILPEYFQPMQEGYKTFEVRKKDRDYRENDYIIFHEWSPGDGYTGRRAYRIITYILDNPEYCKKGYVILGLGY